MIIIINNLYQKKNLCEIEYTHKNAQVIELNENNYVCPYKFHKDNECNTIEYTSKCDELIRTNQTGLCDNGYKCCNYDNSERCIKSTDHVGYEIKYGTCYNPTIIFNITNSDGSIEKITHYLGLCIPPSEQTNLIGSYGCMKQELNEYYLDQKLNIYIKFPDTIKKEQPDCEIKLDNLTVLGLCTLPIFILITGFVGIYLCIIEKSSNVQSFNDQTSIVLNIKSNNEDTR
jgi:hypothetical protein